MGTLKKIGRKLRRHAAGNLRHRCEQGQLSRRVNDGFVGEGRYTGRHEVMGLLGVGSQMQISEDNLAASQLLPFGSERLFDLHNQCGALKYLIRACDDLSASRSVVAVTNTGANSGHRLDRDLMAPDYQLSDRRRSEADAVFVSFDFFRNADEHGRFQTAVSL